MGWLYSDEWAAGFFDGEGCVQIHRRPSPIPQHDLDVQVSQKVREPLEALQAEHGGSIGATKTPSGCWRWRLAGGKAEAFLRRIAPYALVKKDVIALALAFRDTTGRPGRRLPPGVTQRREAFRAAILAANRR